MDLDAAAFDKLVGGDGHIWVVKFHSTMCGSCEAFAPTFKAARDQVDGLHWAAISIDNKNNIALAKRIGVLQEGIPNVKLINAADAPLPIVTGDTPTTEAVVKSLKDTLEQTAATKDAAGFYKSHARSEL